MTELLAIPGWQAPPRTLDDWAEGLRAAGGTVATEPDPPGACWLVVGPLGLRGYALIENGHVEAVHFEVSDADPSAATAALERAAQSLGWEVHADEPDEDDEDDD